VLAVSYERAGIGCAFERVITASPPASSAMKVSIISAGRFHAFDLARELADRGRLFRLITAYPKFKTRQYGVPDDRVVSFPTVFIQHGAHRVSSTLAQRLNRYLDRGFAHFATIHLDGADVLHGWSGYSLPSFRRAPTKLKVLERSSAHVAAHMQILGTEYGRLGMQWRPVPPLAMRRELEEYEEADLIVVPSRFVKRTFIEQGVPEARLLLNPLGVNLDAFRPPDNPRPESAPFRVVYAGQLGVQKGVHHLVRAFQEAGIRGGELDLLGMPNHETERLLGGTDSRVRRLGHVTQSALAMHYQNASVFALASIQDGFGMVLAQAMACGLPIVCTTNTGGEDLLRLSGSLIRSHDEVQEYPAGFLVPPGDPGAMSYCFRLLASDSELLRAKRIAAIETRKAGLDWGSYAERMLLGYQHAASRARRPTQMLLSCMKLDQHE
jgi:alpha-maltose-1-phosphate synthase